MNSIQKCMVYVLLSMTMSASYAQEGEPTQQEQQLSWQQRCRTWAWNNRGRIGVAVGSIAGAAIIFLLFRKKPGKSTVVVALPLVEQVVNIEHPKRVERLNDTANSLVVGAIPRRAPSPIQLPGEFNGHSQAKILEQQGLTQLNLARDPLPQGPGSKTLGRPRRTRKVGS